MDNKETYFFDKRIMKKYLKKYGIMALCILPLLIFVNVYLNKKLDFWITVVVDVTIILVYVFVVEMILYRIKLNKEDKSKKDEIYIRKIKEIKKRKFDEENNNKNIDEETLIVNDKNEVTADTTDANSSENIESENIVKDKQNKKNKKESN